MVSQQIEGCFFQGSCSTFTQVESELTAFHVDLDGSQLLQAPLAGHPFGPSGSPGHKSHANPCLLSVNLPFSPIFYKMQPGFNTSQLLIFDESPYCGKQSSIFSHLRGTLEGGSPEESTRQGRQPLGTAKIITLGP